MADFPTIPPGMGWPFVDATTGEFQSTAVKGWLDDRYGDTLYAPAYGVVGDGVADDASALQALLNMAEALGASVTLGADSTVLIGSTIAPPSGTRLYGNGATIKKKSTLASVAITLVTKSNVLIEKLRIDGQRGLFTSSEHQHGVHITNASENIILRDVVTFDCNGDGIYIGDQTAASKNITIENTHSYGNNRQGMSVSHVSGLSVSNSWFSATDGTNPRAGVDIEPNADGIVCENITFTSCRFSGNGHFGFVVSLRATPSVHQGGMTLLGCHIFGNGTASASFGGGLNLRAARDFQMLGGSIHHNTGPGVRIDWTTMSRAIKVVGVDVYENTQHGLQLTSGFDDLTIADCTFRGNGTGSANTYPGVLIAPTIASTDFRFVGNVSHGATQRYGLQTVVTGGAITNVTLVGNSYRDNATGTRALADDAATRIDVDTAGKAAITGSRGGNAALTSLLTHLTNRGLITNSTTA